MIFLDMHQFKTKLYGGLKTPGTRGHESLILVKNYVETLLMTLAGRMR